MNSDSTPTEPTPRAHSELTRDGILAAIAQEEARLARLDAERADARGRIAQFRAALLASAPETEVRATRSVAPTATAPKTAAEKVKLFRSLFRGRDEVFATRFVSRKTGKSGYAPACRNKFVAGVCGLPQIKCGDCPNQAFSPVDDAAVVAHLTGRHVMGVYPLLVDETRWFLAVDFDKASWSDWRGSPGASSCSKAA